MESSFKTYKFVIHVHKRLFKKNLKTQILKWKRPKLVTVKRNSALLSELIGEISNVESEQNRRLEALATLQNGTVEKLMALVERQSEEIMRLNERVEASEKITGIFFNYKS